MKKVEPVTFMSITEFTRVMESWMREIHNFGFITLADVLETIKRESSEKDRALGWTCIDEFIVKRNSAGWTIIFPELERL